MQCLNKPLPSLQSHYKTFNTTTEWSAPTEDICTSNSHLFHTRNFPFAFFRRFPCSE